MMHIENYDTTSIGDLKFSVVTFLILMLLMLLNSAANVCALLNISPCFRESQLEIFYDSNILYLQSKAPLGEAFQNVMQS